jgi:hypothetical protein
VFAESDGWGGGTDAEGHRFMLAYQIAKPLLARVSYYASTKGVSAEETDYDRYFLDFIAKF